MSAPKLRTKKHAGSAIRKIDKAAIASQRMKKAYIAAREKEKALSGAYKDSKENAPEQYAVSTCKSETEHVMRSGIRKLEKYGRKGISETKENIRAVSEAAKLFREDRADHRTKERADIKAQTDSIRSYSESQHDQAKRNIKYKPQTDPEKSRDLARKNTVAGTRKSRYANSYIIGRNSSQETRSLSPKNIISSCHTHAGIRTKNTCSTATHAAPYKIYKHTRIKKRPVPADALKSNTANAHNVPQNKVDTAGKTAGTARVAARKALVTAKKTANTAAASIKMIINASRALAAALAAGAWIAVVIIAVISMTAFMASSVYGIFFSGEDPGNGISMRTAVTDINSAYDQRIEDIKNSQTYDALEMSGSKAVWKDVMAVYAVKTNTDPDDPQEVVTMNASKQALLTEIFWVMNEITYHIDVITETSTTETDDGAGNIIQTDAEVTVTKLYITVSHKTALDMADLYGFSAEQRKYLQDLLNEENDKLWSSVLYGIYSGKSDIVAVAASQIGNKGGSPYWSWYGFTSRVEWCACFVSWCADQCGYIDMGVMPKYASCRNGMKWFKDRGQWLDGSAVPSPGMIIFFDWRTKHDGIPDHTGIVAKVENGMIYTVEGNSGDACRERSYKAGHYEILGYGTPAY